MITRKAAVIASSSALLLASGVALGNPYLIASSVTLTVFLAMARIFAEEPSAQIEVDQEWPGDDLYEGEDAEITLKVLNRGSGDGVLELDDRLPDGLKLEAGTNQIVAPLGGVGRQEFAFTVRPKVFGVHRIGPIRVRVFDHLGLFMDRRKVDSYAVIKVYPRVRYMRRMNIGPPVARTWPGEILTNRRGQGMEFYGVREYMPGDRLNRINWKASSRYDELFSNQTRGEFGGDALIVLDVRTRSDLGTAPESILTYASRAAAEIAYRLLRDKNRVGLLTFGESLGKVRPGTGRKQFVRILTSLMSTKTGEGFPIDLLPRYLTLFFSKVDQVVVISPLLDFESRDAVTEVASLGIPIMAVSPSPSRFEAARKQEDRVGRIAEELTLLDRRAKLSVIRRYAPVVDWNTAEPLDQTLRAPVPLRVRVARTG